jgi:hypothetical protein
VWKKAQAQKDVEAQEKETRAREQTQEEEVVFS